MGTVNQSASIYGQDIQYVNSTHRYVVNASSIPSVTKIMAEVLAKPELMLWPLNIALKYLEEITLTRPLNADDLLLARTAHVRGRESGASRGTAFHAIAEQRLHLDPIKRLRLVREELPEEVYRAAVAYEAWYMDVMPEVLASEQIIYSKRLHYAGMIDAILQIDGQTLLVDFKTTKASKTAPSGVYPENFIQLSGYYTALMEQKLWEEEHMGASGIPEIHDLAVISVRADNVNLTLASSCALRLNETWRLWSSVMALYKGLHKLKGSIK